MSTIATIVDSIHPSRVLQIEDNSKQMLVVLRTTRPKITVPPNKRVICLVMQSLSSILRLFLILAIRGLVGLKTVEKLKKILKQNVFNSKMS